MNTPTLAATDEPASPSTPAQAEILARDSGLLTESLISEAIACGHDSRPGWRQRIDGWTPDRIRAFIDALSQCGVVADAARAAGLSQQSAYAFRNSPKGRAFDIAWRAAIIVARRRVADLVMSRAINGTVEVIVRDGKVWGERHRFDNRLTMAVLTRLDSLARQNHQREDVLDAVAQELPEFIDRVCEGGEAAADFIRIRCRPFVPGGDEAEFLERAEHYLRTGAGLPEDEEDEDEEDDGEYDGYADDEADDADENDSGPPSTSSAGEDLSSGVEDDRAARRGQPSAEEETPTNSNIQFHQLYPDPPRARLGDRSPQASPLDRPGKGNDDHLEGGGGASSPAAHRPTQPAGGVCEEEEEDHQAVSDESSPSPGSLGVWAQVQRDAGCLAPAQHPAEAVKDQPEWILGDDGIAVRTVNGKLPSHHHRRRTMGDFGPSV